MNTEYYIDRITEKSFIIGALQYHVKHLADLILSLPADDYTKRQAIKTLEDIKNVEAFAKEQMGKDKSNLTATEGR